MALLCTLYIAITFFFYSVETELNNIPSEV